MVASIDAAQQPAILLNYSRHISVRSLLSNSYIQYLDDRVRLLALLLHHIEHTGDGLANVALEFIDRLALRITAWKCWDFAQKPPAGSS